ncbi:MAG: DUF3604 domain-containing protein [Novosphingobium sp.]|nr:DUF3604 domain-containing protein [Novosphingobium sp.]MCP5403609.1 DUF3604 domain-containing protein [Novosphingobium sp.]
MDRLKGKRGGISILAGIAASAFAAAFIIVPALGSPSSDAAQAPASESAAIEKQPFSPPLREPAENSLYWGDLHLHTNLSFDAYMQGNTQTSPEDAYRFAMGETVTADNGVQARLRRPLDFLAVTDHAQSMGLLTSIDRDEPLLAGTSVKERWTEIKQLVKEKGLREGMFASIRKHGMPPNLPEAVQRNVWKETAATADRLYRPGKFTTLIGYEWTAMIDGDNLHRVVLYRDYADRAGQTMPFSAQDSNDPEDLWAALARYEDNGGRVLAIAHNGNVSNGRMFAPNRINGKPLDRKYAELRSRWEPVYEVTQVKGDGETHPALSPTDEFADFERWDQGNVAETEPKQPWMLRYEYARSALLDGLLFERKLGANPFKFGMIGSTDSHTGLSTTSEDNFFGKFLNSEPRADRDKESMSGAIARNWELGASGLTAVWAPENTREAIFDALRCREVYATSGSRIRLRFFGGWGFAKGDIDRADYARFAYRHGVPMGGDLPRSASAGAPTFLIHAARDPDSANLDRAQVIKGWIDAKGERHEKIFNVALSDGRKVGKDGKVKPVGSTVDAKTATYRNSIGDPELATWWRDPEFDPTQPAFYYVRVLEIPRPRWTTYDAAFFGRDPSPDAPVSIQDRAYSSPIWYRP